MSGGCVEGAVYELAGATRKSHGARRCSATAVSDDDAFTVGLTCGGIIDIFVEAIDRQSFPELGDIADDIEAGHPGRRSRRSSRRRIRRHSAAA